MLSILPSGLILHLACHWHLEKNNVLLEAENVALKAGTSSLKRKDVELETPIVKKQAKAIVGGPWTEFDDVFDENKTSIETIIKRAAMGLHNRFVNKEQLNQRERKIMSNGLSSIIDFADKSSKSQKSLFTSGTFEELEAMYQEKLKIEREQLDPLIMHTCQIIFSVVKKTKRISDGIDYLYKLYPKYLSVVDKKNKLKLLEHMYVDAS
ncbi:hypothetical protein BDF14DRAFT_1840570 [Spinellus fusiger]|nr:hypothetical protein BDF14DRAFT_1840570 [Spinellus fusiger]